MRQKGTALDAVEAAYDLSGSPSAWLTRVLAALDRLPHAGGAVACAGWRFDNHVIDDVTLLRGPAELPEMVRGLHESVGPEQRQPTYAYGGPGLHSMLDVLRQLSLDVRQPQIPRLVAESFSSLGVADFHVLLAHDASLRGCLIGWGVTAPTAIDARTNHRLVSLAVHVTAAHRLLTAPLTEEAVLEGDQLVHAEGPARDLDAQEHLRRAARAIDRARLRGTDEDEALELWQGLVAGRWSLVDRFDSDGRRFLVARRNDEALAEPRALSPRERAILVYAGLGHSNKLMGYELGLSESAVANHVASVVRKLGLPNRAALFSLVASLVAPSARVER